MSIGNVIRNYRTENKISQEELGQQIGVSRQAVSKWETDEVSPSAVNLIALSKYFDISVEEFFRDEETKSHSNVEPAIIEQKPTSEKKSIEKSKSIQIVMNGIVKIATMMIGLVAAVILIELVVFLIFYR